MHFVSKKPSKNQSKTTSERWTNRCHKRSVFESQIFRDFPSILKGLGLQVEAKLAQNTVPELSGTRLEASWCWQELVELDLEAIWVGFGRVWKQFWLPSWSQVDPKWLKNSNPSPFESKPWSFFIGNRLDQFNIANNVDGDRNGTPTMITPTPMPLLVFPARRNARSD